MVDLSVTLSGVKLDNPIIPASGTFGFGYEFADWYDINVLGSISLKGTTKEPRFGNPTPRIAEIPSGLLNSVGLQNPGVDDVIEKEIPRLAKCFSKPLIANISGFSVEDYVYCAEKFDKVSQVGILEINISCPNVHGGGMSFGTSPKDAAKVTFAVKKAVKKPVYIKLTPNVTDIAEIARAVEEAGADGISLINTPLGMRIDISRRKPILSNKTGGMSGPCVLPLALRMVFQAYEAVKIPIIGMGGISSANDVIEMMLAGASAVQVGAANLVDPCACRNIIEELPAVCEKYGIKKISEITGGAHNG
ncbi:MAG: dihydroorotate dehydrogenase [Clostridiales bacterium]|nr:dihydroorotate dehydrogenase [Clostridiales bacterium]